LLNRDRQTLFNLKYVVEGKVLRFLAQVVSKSIDLSSVYAHFMKRPKKDPIHQAGGPNPAISHEWLDILS